MRIRISGTVQGVGFRPSVYRAAVAVGADGTVRNDGSTVVIDTDKGEELLSALLSHLPPLAHVDSVVRYPSEYRGERGFRIVQSSGTGNGMSIPADSAVCDRCVAEMVSGRRKGYPFTTCTDCGPRFTLLRGIPYDRPVTSMSSFPMCEECEHEFSTPGDRRFHHQTIACQHCGPEYRLETADGVEYDNAIAKTAALLDSGKTVIVKGWGGMHICCTLDCIHELREWYGRKNKPFAIMVRDIAAVRRYGRPTVGEEETLLSPQRPIVLVRKVDCEETEEASPGLDTVGIFLPYTGMHHLLFSHLKHDALVMTSANPPGEPMAVTDAEARSLHVDGWLLHNQEIVNRADDTVVRLHGLRTAYIRRSRGAVPYSLPAPCGGDAIALGAQENLVGAVASGGRIWPTQYIGDGDKIGVPEYLYGAVRKQLDLLSSVPEAVAVDLHPGYSNRRIAGAMAAEFDVPIIEVQHHWAHSASLMVDNGIGECVTVAVDGTGYGDDGTAWGGEVMVCDFTSYVRKAHLQPIPLLGSERALYDLRRLTFAVDAINGVENTEFDEKDAFVLGKMMNRSVTSTSLGRVLDALSHRLGVCSLRTYDGEPAMKLETLLNRGTLVDGYEVRTVKGTVQTAELFARISPSDRREDVAYSIVHNIVEELASLAAQEAEASGIRHVGITGGVSYNGVVSRVFENTVSSHNLVPVFHRDVPNGDGGISVGQVAIALKRISRLRRSIRLNTCSAPADMRKCVRTDTKCRWNVHIYVHHSAIVTTVNITQARNDLFNLVNDVQDGERILIVSKKRNAVLMSEEEYESLMETLYLLSDPTMASDLKDAAEIPITETEKWQFTK